MKLIRVGTTPNDALFQEPPRAYTPGSLKKTPAPAPEPKDDAPTEPSTSPPEQGDQTKK
jgi:hypothetical protein